MKPTYLKLKNYYSPWGIDTSNPIFSWQLTSNQNDQRQSSYILLVAEDEQALKRNEGSMWDTGKVASSEQLHIVYAGKPLRSVHAYYWKVGVWNQEDQLEWSDVSSFYTGYLDKAAWSANWLGNGTAKPFYMRTSFQVDRVIKMAFALVSGLGHFKLYMNGKKVGNHELDPGWTNYNKAVQYVCFEVTDELRQGMNTIGLTVGNGFFAGDDGGRHFYTMGKGYEPYGNQLMAIGEWHVEYEDGTRELIETDGSGKWKVHDSATTLANVYGSENMDARLYPNGWFSNDFNASDWQEAIVLAPPSGQMVVQNQPPITVKRIYDTIGISEPHPNVYVFDLGQNMSAMFEIYVSGPAGAKVTIKPGELMNEDGTIATPWDIVTYSEYTLSGSGQVEIWKPDFSYYGARWVQIEGCTRDEEDQSKPYIHDVKGHFVSSESSDTGKLETTHPQINQVEQMIVKAIESNLQSVHSDCPTIEKLGWLETAGLMGPSIMYVKDVEALWLKIMRDMIEAQTEDGLIPDIAPEYSKFEGGFRDSIAWGSSILIVPDLLLETYGNRTAVAEAYPAMKAYMAYLKTKEVYGGFIQHGLGDWGIEPQTGGDYIENVETAFYYYNYELLVKFAAMLGYKEDAALYGDEAKRIKQVYNDRLLQRSTDHGGWAYGKMNGQLDPQNQVIQAMPLSLNLVPADKRIDIEQALLKAASSHQLRSGEIGLRFLFDALGAMNRNDIVFEMMMQPEHPSYIRFAHKGETSLPEFWTDNARSRNHDMMGHILEWMYKRMLGISSVRDAYKEISIAPYLPVGLNHIQGSYHSVRGMIRVAFTQSEKERVLHVSIPPNTIANVKMPILSANCVLLRNNEQVAYEIITEANKHYAVVNILSGTYSFSY